MSRRRKGVSTILGAAIFVGILVLAFSSLQFFMRDLAALSDSYTKMTTLDEDRRNEILVIDKIALAQLSSNSINISASSIAGGPLYPLTNMNFTGNADGWAFSTVLYNAQTPPNPPVSLTQNTDEDKDGSTSDDRELETPNNNGVLPTGGFNGGWSADIVPSQSGAGSIFAHFSHVSSDNNKEGGAMMKWTYKFSLDANTAAAINDAVFSFGYYIPKVPDVTEVKGPAKNDKAIIMYTIKTPSGTTFPIEIEEPNDEISWNAYNIPSSRLRDSGNNPITWTAGEYTLQITTMVDLKAKTPSDKKVSQFLVHFDDVGIKFNLKSASGQSVKVNSYTDFDVSSPATVSSLDFSIQGSSSVPATQYVYLYDFARSQWTLLLSSSVSSSTGNVKLTKAALDVPRFVAQIGGNYVVDPGVTQPAVVGDVWVRIIVSAVTINQFNYTATLSLDTQITQNDKVSFVVSNTGGITAHIVRYWIVTGAEIKKVDADTYLDPGRSATLSQTIIPTSGTVEIRVITERGSIASLTETI